MTLVRVTDFFILKTLKNYLNPYYTGCIQKIFTNLIAFNFLKRKYILFVDHLREKPSSFREYLYIVVVIFVSPKPAALCVSVCDSLA